MRLQDILRPECVAAPLKATDKQNAIFELVDLVVQHHGFDEADALKKAVWARETTRTTGIGHGVAIPHGKLDKIDHLVMGVGMPAEPIEFGSIDGKPVKLIILLVSPQDQTGPHIQALARISQILMPEDARNEIMSAASAKQCYDLFIEHESRAVV